MHEPSVPTPPAPPALPVPHVLASGSRHDPGAGHHDQPFAGFRSYQFSTRELAQLVLRRSDVLDARLGRWAQDLGAA